MNENEKTEKVSEEIKEKTADPRKKRDIIKNVLIVFLAVLLVLTFYSNTILNKSLAEISTERSTSGKLTERIRGSGLVESNQSYEVTVDGNKTIDSILVKRGQEIEKDTVLFTVGAEENEEVAEAEELLSSLELEYQKAMLTPPVNYSKENQAINNARSDLAAAIEKRDSALNNQGNVEEAKRNYQFNKSQFAYYTKLQTKLQNTISAIDTDEYSLASSEYTGEIVQLLNAYKSAEADYTKAYSFYTSLFVSDSDAPITQETLDSAKAEADSKALICDEAKSKYESAKYELRNNLTQQLSDAENNIDYYSNLVSEYEDSMTSNGMGMSIDELEADVQTKQRLLEELIAELNQTKDDNSAQDKINSLELDAKKKEIDKQKEKLSKLREKCGITEIKSKYSGIISEITIKPGDMTVPEMPCMIIDLVDEGFTTEISVDAEKCRKIKKGTAAEVVNNWKGDIEAVVTNIKNDTTAGSKKRILVFSVTGDVDSGTFIDLSIPCSTANYDVIVPKSAVYEDSNGKFVLTVESKSSPLGNRYYARRIDVEVESSDEVSSAVSGNITMGDYVITASNLPVKPNDQVRMKSE